MTNPISTSNANPLVTTSGAIIGGTFYAELIQVLFDLRWLVLFIIALVFTDFCSGLTASVKNKKKLPHGKHVRQLSVLINLCIWWLNVCSLSELYRFQVVNEFV